ncbi:hypothetical protein GLYMA_13G223200v4 [Glycine max]|uniref:Uncharacterized protein n=1 Tax=Glycine max TaxID=3847 RepID=A0A0R0GS90_SOYBN|nr:hypothetical protein GYH30_037032 [Glycine max]KRH21148.1 hypothetical protein GLYMA_13G223200v4 [Glycine max]
MAAQCLPNTNQLSFSCTFSTPSRFPQVNQTPLLPHPVTSIIPHSCSGAYKEGDWHASKLDQMETRMNC